MLIEWLLDISVIVEMPWRYGLRDLLSQKPEINWSSMQIQSRLNEVSYTLLIMIFKLSFKDKRNKRIIYVYSAVTHKNIIKVLNLSKEMWCTKLNSAFSWKGVPSERSGWCVRYQFWSWLFFQGMIFWSALLWFPLPTVS